MNIECKWKHRMPRKSIVHIATHCFPQLSCNGRYDFILCLKMNLLLNRGSKWKLYVVARITILDLSILCTQNGKIIVVTSLPFKQWQSIYFGSVVPLLTGTGVQKTCSFDIKKREEVIERFWTSTVSNSTEISISYILYQCYCRDL